MDRLSTNQPIKFTCRPDLTSFNSIINAWAKSRDRDRARKAEAILHHMERQYATGRSDLRPNVITYATVINAWARSGEVDAPQKAESVLRRIDQLYQEGDDGVKPDVYTFTSVIDALGRKGTVESAERAMEVLQTMEERYRDTGDEDVRPDVRTHTSAIIAVSRSGTDPQTAEDILDRLEETADAGGTRIDTECYNSMIQAWEYSNEPGKAVHAWAVYRWMVDRCGAGVSTVQPDIVGLNSVLGACSFTDVQSEVDRKDALRIADQAFKFVTASKPKYGRPDHIVFSTMLMVL